MSLIGENWCSPSPEYEDLENINLKESPNFLNTKIEPKNTNRETFRITKDSFDKIGNHIEANKFFVYEMKKHKELV